MPTQVISPRHKDRGPPTQREGYLRPRLGFAEAKVLALSTKATLPCRRRDVTFCRREPNNYID